MSQHDAGQRLDFDVLERPLLMLGEGTHLSLGEADVFEIARGDLRHGPLDLLGAKAEGFGRPVVEFGR